MSVTNSSTASILKRIVYTHVLAHTRNIHAALPPTHTHTHTYTCSHLPTFKIFHKLFTITSHWRCVMNYLRQPNLCLFYLTQAALNLRHSATVWYILGPVYSDVYSLRHVNTKTALTGTLCKHRQRRIPNIISGHQYWDVFVFYSFEVSLSSR